MTVSVWWLVAMFLVGGYAGILVFELMSMAARAHEQVVKEGEAVERDRLGPVDQEEEWTRLGSPVERAGSMWAD
jgi:hypothetical protein